MAKYKSRATLITALLVIVAFTLIIRNETTWTFVSNIKIIWVSDEESRNLLKKI